MTEDFCNPRKLKWACRRGMLELDVILERYVENCYDQADEETKAQFHQLLLCQDQDLFDWMVKHETVAAEYRDIVKKVLAGMGGKG